MSLYALSSSVRSASHPVLMQEAISAFNTTTPYLDLFLNKGREHCNAFKGRYPEIEVVKGRKYGTVQSYLSTFAQILKNVNHATEPSPPIPLTEEESHSYLFDLGRQSLQEIQDNLDHLEDLLMAPQYLDTKSATLKEIQQLREKRYFLDSCPPSVRQSPQAMEEWREGIEKELLVANQLVENFYAKETERLIQNGNAATALTLRNMVEAKLDPPMSEKVFASFVADEIGANTAIQRPNLQKFTTPLKELAAHSKNPLFIQATEDVAAFESFLQPFKERMRAYPIERFFNNGAEFQEILTPATKQFTEMLKGKLDELDKKKRSALFVPLSDMANLFAIKHAENLFKLLHEHKQLSKTSYSLLRIEKNSAAPSEYDIRIYETAHEGEGPFSPYRLFSGVKRSALTNQNFIKELLQYATSSTEAKKLQQLSSIISEKWGGSWEKCGSWMNPFQCYLNRFGTTFAETVEERVKDLALSFEAMMGLSKKNREDFFEFLSKSLTPKQDSNSPLQNYPGKNPDNPWGIWEALLLGEGTQEHEHLLFDLKLAALVHLSHANRETDEKTEIFLNLAKAGLASLSRKLSELSLPNEKFLYAHSVMNGVKARLSEKERALHRALAAKIEPVSTHAVFESYPKHVLLDSNAPPLSEAPPKISKLEWIGQDLVDWTPTASDLEPMHQFAESLNEAYKKENYDGIIQSASAFFAKCNLVTLKEPFWDDLSPQDAEAFLLSLEKISTAYFKSYFDANVPHLPSAESSLLMMEAMTLADKVLGKLPHHHLNDYHLPLSDFAPYLFNRGIFFKLGDPKLDERLRALRSHVEASPSSRESLFSTNMAPLKRRLLGALTGDLITVPRITIEGTAKMSIPEHVPESFFLDDWGMRDYVGKFFDQYDSAHPNSLLKAEKAVNMLTGEVSDVLPRTFYAARMITFITQYFARGTFVKPAGFKKTPKSYEVSFEALPVSDMIMPFMSTVMEKFVGVKIWYLLPKVEGIDASVFVENKELPDGFSSAHQFAHLQRPVVDPVINSTQSAHLTIQGKPALDAFSRGGGGNRFRNFAPGITEAGRNLHDLNAIMVAPNQDLKKYLSKQEYEIVASLRTEPAVQIANTLSFFREKSNLLKIPDMQTYFSQLIFDPPLLLEELKLPNRGPELERQLSDFVGGEYFLNFRMGNIEAADFYLGLGMRLLQYSRFARKENPSVYANAKELPEFYKNLPSILEDAIVKASEDSKGTLHGIAALEWLSKDSLSDGEAFLRHAILHHRFPPSGKTVDPLLSANVKQLLSRFAPEVIQLDKDGAFFHKIAHEAYPELPKDGEYEQSEDNPLVFTLKDQPVSIDLQQGLVVAAGISGIPLPADGLHSPAYTSLYGIREFRCKAINRSTFEFKDHLGKINRLVRQPDGSFVLQRQFLSRNNNWYQSIPQDLLLDDNDRTLTAAEKKLKDILAEIPQVNKLLEKKDLPILPAMPLIERHSHWYTDGMPPEILILDHTGRIVYRADLTGSSISPNMKSVSHTINRIHTVLPNGADHLMWVDLAQAFSWTKQFEEPEQTLVWKDPKTEKPERIEFPRFGLEGLSFKKEGSLFQSEQFPGFFLKRNQVNPLGAHCPNFLLLQNKKGEERLILAGQKITPSQKSSLTSRLSFERDGRVVGQRIPFYAYDKVNGDKGFSSQEIEANLYLAMILGAKKRYKEAMLLLRQFGQGSNPFNQNEEAILEWTQNLGKTIHNDSPQMTALRTLAGVTLDRNKVNNEDEAAKQAKKEQKDSGSSAQSAEETKKQSNAAAYFKMAGKLGLFRLSLEEEFFLLKHAIYKGEEPPDEVRRMMQHAPEKASEMISVLGNQKPLDYAEVKRILAKPPALLKKSDSFESLPIEPILKNPLGFVENIGKANGNLVEDALKALFERKEITPIQKKALEFYLEDCIHYLRNKDHSDYRLKDLGALRAKRIELEQTYRYMNEALAQAELSMLRLATKLPADPIEQARRQSRTDGNTQAPLELNELIHLFMNRNLSALKIRNPELTDTDIKELDGLIDLFLDLSIQNFQRKRVIVKIADIEEFEKAGENDPMLKLALQSFVAEANVKRNYPEKENRALKVFEYHNGFYYRKNQIEKLKALGVELEKLDPKDLLESYIIELMVGAGKTTYLLPTKGYWSADGKHLSMAVMPESLIGNMSREVERIFGKTFAQKVRRFKFDINTPLTEKNLKSILTMLSDAITNRDFLITTDRSIKAFENQFKKVLFDAIETQDEGKIKTADWMLEIKKVFKEKAEVICDEVDLINDPRRELNFPSGEKKSIAGNYLSLSIKIYQLLTSPDIKKLASFEFSPSSADAVTPNAFEKKIKPALADKIIESLSTEELGSLKNFYASLNQKQKKLLELYFKGEDPEHVAENWIRKDVPEAIREELGLVRGALNVLLPLTLSKNAGERYGFLTEDSIVAGPFSGSNSPNIGSQFSDPFECIFYTIQLYLKEPGMSRRILENLVVELQTKAWKEMIEHKDEIKKGIKVETEAEKEFERYFGKRENLHLFHPEIVDLLMEIMKTDSTAKWELIEKYVLPEVKVYDENLKATSQITGYFFQKARGFTGTLWNAGTYHDVFKAVFDKGARGQVVALAYTQAKGKVATIKSADPEALLQKLLDTPNYRHIRALIDSGGVLKDLYLETLAKRFLDKFVQDGTGLEGVVFFDQNDRPMIWEKGQPTPIPLSKSAIPPEKRFTIYDQRHTTGTDIKQAINATALVTVSKGMIMRDFVQGVGRMRQLASGQKIELAIMESDALAMRELLKLDSKTDLTIEDAIVYLILNESRRQGDDNQVATNHKLRASIQEWLFDKVLDESSVQDIVDQLEDPKAFAQFLKNLFFQKSSISPFNNYGQGTELVDTDAAYRLKIDATEKQLDLENVFQNEPFLEDPSIQKAQDLMQKAILQGKANLPEKVSASTYVGDMEEEQEVQQEQETQQEQQQQQEVQNEKKAGQNEKKAGQKPWRHLPWIDLNQNSVEAMGMYEPNRYYSLGGDSLLYYSLGRDSHFLSANNVMPKDLQIFDPAFQLSNNFQLLNVPYDKPIEPFGEFQKPLQNILIAKDLNAKNQYKLNVIEPYDAAAYKAALQKRQDKTPMPKDPDITSSDGWTIVFSNGHHFSHDSLAKDYFSHQNDWTCLNVKRVYCSTDPLAIESIRLTPGGNPASVWIGDIDLNSLYESENPIPKDELSIEKNPRLGTLLVQAEYFDGCVNYPENKQKLLMEWLAGQLPKAGPERLEKIDKIEGHFRKTIIAFKEDAKRDYPKSSLAKIFQDLREGKTP